MAYLDTVAYEVSKRLLHKVFGLMALALSITGLTSWFLYASPSIFAYIVTNSAALAAIVIGQLVTVFALSRFINRMNASVALFFYFLYSVLVGVTCSSLLYIYTMQSIALTFIICAATFAAVAFYGYATDADLSTWGTTARMGIFGIIIASLSNLYFQSEAFDFIISFIGVAIFTVLTAYDVQQLKGLGYDAMRSPEEESRLAIIGALSLYLDFINLFLMLLRMIGRRRN